ncbi:MAG: GGDEF domain-containing protein [Betaproteobacteria bacterium]
MSPIGFTSPIESSAASYWLMLRRITVWAAGICVGFLLLYGALGARALALMNLASVALYTAAWWLLKTRRNQPAVALIWLEVLVHATAGSLLLGWEADFHLFLLLFMPAIVLGSPNGRSRALLALLLVSYPALYVACRNWAPLSPLPPAQLEVARWFNIALVFGLFYAVVTFYRQRVRCAEQALWQLARIDALTRLANRTHFQERAVAEISRARRAGEPLTLMLADVDHFKRVNDEHGHEAGDRVLAQVARVMTAALREHDVLARWGGEEFMALLPDTDAALGRAVAERVRLAVASHPVVVDGRPITVTLSFGLATLADGDLHAATLAADRALYASKHTGRNRVTHADDRIQPLAA